jgi:hypothetical protein
MPDRGHGSREERTMTSRHSLTRLAFAVATALLLCAGAHAADEGQAPSSPETKTKTYRYGVGWDEGLAFRARLGDGWGVGLRINPDFVDPESETSSQFNDDYEYTCYWIYSSPSSCRHESEGQSQTTTTGDRRTFSATFMLYHERPFGKWLAAGPYLALGYERQSRSETSHTESRDEWTEEYPWTPRPNEGDGERVTDTTVEHWQRSAIVELGIRPVFRFHERFTLETRFGVELRFTDWHETRRTHSQWKNDSSDIVYRVERSISSVSATRGAYDTEDRSEGSERRFRTVGERLGPGAELRFIVHF